MKVDAQIEEECRRTICYLQRYSCPKLYISFKKLSNQKRSANTFRNIRRTTLCWMRGKIEELLFIKVTVFLPLSFRKKNSAKQDIASTEIAYQFLAPKVPVLRRNKATNPSTSTDPFSAATKTFVLEWMNGNSLILRRIQHEVVPLVLQTVFVCQWDATLWIARKQRLPHLRILCIYTALTVVNLFFFMRRVTLRQFFSFRYSQISYGQLL